MTAQNLSFENDGLTIQATWTPTEGTVAWTGESDSRNPGDFLNPLILRLSKMLAGRSVTIDFSGLKYMNSSTVAPLLVCIKTFNTTATSVLVTFSDVDWQRTHVQCVRTISRALKNVRVEVKPSVGTSRRPNE